jgi:hypothetical protein
LDTWQVWLKSLDKNEDVEKLKNPPGLKKTKLKVARD